MAITRPHGAPEFGGRSGVACRKGMQAAACRGESPLLSAAAGRSAQREKPVAQTVTAAWNACPEDGSEVSFENANRPGKGKAGRRLFGLTSGLKSGEGLFFPF